MAFVFAAALTGSGSFLAPVEAAGPPGLCARLQDGIRVLTDLAEAYPDNPLIAAFLAAAKDSYAARCQ